MNNKYEMFRKELSNNADIEELLKKIYLSRNNAILWKNNKWGLW